MKSRTNGAYVFGFTETDVIEKGAMCYEGLAVLTILIMRPGS